MNSNKRLFLIFLMAFGVGLAGGLFGVGGGVLLVPVLVVVFGFDQHLAQGTSLVAMVPPTGLLAFLNYAAAGEVRLDRRTMDHARGFFRRAGRNASGAQAFPGRFATRRRGAGLRDRCMGSLVRIAEMKIAHSILIVRSRRFGYLG